MSQNDHTARYLAEAARLASLIDAGKIERMVLLCCELRDRGGRIFFLGNGGGAAHASHAASDFRKIAGIECYSPSDNVAELTARINDHQDDGWATAYADWLRVSKLSSRDAIFVFSVGGGSVDNHISVNLVNCVKLARAVGAQIAGVVGRDGGYTAAMGDEVLVIPALSPDTVTAHTESFQAVVWHCIVTHPALKVNQTKWESQQ